MLPQTTRRLAGAATAAAIIVGLTGCAVAPAHHPDTATAPSTSPTPSKAPTIPSAPKPPAEATDTSAENLGFNSLPAGTEPVFEFPISALEQKGWYLDGNASRPDQGDWEFTGPNGVLARVHQQRIADLPPLPDDRTATTVLMNAGHLTGEFTVQKIKRSGGGSMDFLVANSTSEHPEIPGVTATRLFADQSLGLGVVVNAVGGDEATAQAAAKQFFDTILITSR